MSTSSEQSMADKFEGPAIGIDLGTTYSCVAIWQHGGVVIIVNGHGNRTTPSCVAFTEEECLIGEAAENQWIRNPTNTVFGVKRLIGKRFHDPSVEEHIELYPFKLVAGPESQTKILVNYRGEARQFDPKEISSMILDNMRKIAESYTGRRVTNAVITVPAHFNDSQRRATKEAGDLAGLNVIRILNEPMAAAIAYGLQNQIHHHDKDKNILVFDLGGGTFDVSVFNIDGGQLKVMAISGDSFLGGEDFNNRMVSYFCQEFKRKNGKDISDSPRALRRLRTACERAKRFLSFNTNINVEVDCLYEGIDFESKITRASFEEMNSDLFLRCMEIMERCLVDGGIDRSDVEEVVLVGGSTRMPKFEKMLKDYFDDTVEICKSINPDECVAYGAAVLAAKITGEAINDDDITNNILNDLVLSDVTPLSLGIEIFGGIMSIVIPRNTPIPSRKEQIYAAETDGDGTTDVVTRIYEGERGFVKDNNFLGEFTLQGIPPSPAGSIDEITISFEIDADGILTVSMVHRPTGMRNKITIDYDVSRTDEAEIENLVKEGEIYREEDEEQGDCVYHMALLEDVLEALKVGLMKLGGEKRRKMEVAMERVSDWLNENQFAAASEFVGKVMELQEVWEEIVGS